MNPSPQVLKGDRLIDGKGGEISGSAVVVVESGRITAVGSERETRIPQGAEIIDVSDCTLMPGLIDTHLHLSFFNGLTFNNYRSALFETTPQLQTFYALFHAQIMLEMGFTSLRDVGAVGHAGLMVPEMVALRDAINQGIVVGPRLLVSAFTHITSSHFDLLLPRAANRASGITADGPWELRKLARLNLRHGCDVIKTCASGGGGTDKEDPDVRNMTQDELDAIVDEAHAFHKPCACHCFTPEAQKMAMKAQVDSLEHCVWTDDEAIAMMRDTNTPLVPTLCHRTDRAIELRRRIGTPEFVLRKMKTIQPHTRETFKRLHQAGVRIAMGTDTQYDPEMGANAMEFEIYVSYGMTPMEAIKTATQTAAEVLKMDKELGTLDSGKYADIIAVAGNPLKDIRILQDRHKIKLVMKGGKVYVDRREGYEKHIILDAAWQRRLDEILAPCEPLAVSP